MAQIHNSDLIKGISKNAGIQISRENVPNQLAEKVVPTMETNPELLRKISIVRSTTGTNATSTTIYTTPTDQDFYLCAMAITMIKDVTATSNATAIVATINGAVISILKIPGITLTVQESNVQVSLPFPLKIDRGTAINITHSTNVANVVGTGHIYGFINETSNI